VGASLLIHLAILGPLTLAAMGIDGPRGDDSPDVLPLYIEIEPRPLLPGEVRRTRVAPPEAPIAIVPPLPASAAGAREAPFRTPDDEEDQRPSAPAPRAAGAAPPGVAVPAGPIWRDAPDGVGDRIADSLRRGIPGCRSGVARTQAERALCEDRFAARSAGAPPITGSGDPQRDAAFAAQGARELARYEARRRPLAGGTGVVTSGECVGGNLGIGCPGAHLDPSMRQGASTTVVQ